MERLASLIQSKMLRDGLTYQDLARRSGISASQLNNIVTKKNHQPDLRTLAALAPVLHKPLYELVEAAGYNLGMPPIEDATKTYRDADVAARFIDRLGAGVDRIAAFEALPPELKEAVWKLVDTLAETGQQQPDGVVQGKQRRRFS